LQEAEATYASELGEYRKAFTKMQKYFKQLSKKERASEAGEGISQALKHFEHCRPVEPK